MSKELSELEKDILRYVSTEIKYSGGDLVLKPVEDIVDYLQKEGRATPEETRRLIDGLCQQGLLEKWPRGSDGAEVLNITEEGLKVVHSISY